MPRSARIVALGYPHHITQRGNNKCTVFWDSEDYAKYLSLFEEYKNKYALDIVSYCLMPNHLHVKAIPNQSDSFYKTFLCTQTRYTQYFNRKYNKVGHLWHRRYFSCPLDEKHAYAVTKYIELNPVTAGYIATPEEWQWSSANEHLGIKKGLISLFPQEKICDISNWRKYLEEGVSDISIAKINKYVLSGRPLGKESFVAKLEKIFNRSLEYKPIGRPRIK